MLDFSAPSADDPVLAARLAGVIGRQFVGREIADNPDAMTVALKELGQTRDQAVFARLFRFYAPRIKTYLRKLGTDDATAEELAQEAMLAVWRKAEFFDPTKANAGTWIFAIARNLRVDRLRRERRPEIDADDPALVEDPAPIAEETVSAQQSERRVRLALADLPPDQAQVVTLSFYEDRPHAEIAARLGIPLGTVKSRLRLAMKRIRGSLGDIAS